MKVSKISTEFCKLKRPCSDNMWRRKGKLQELTVSAAGSTLFHKIYLDATGSSVFPSFLWHFGSQFLPELECSQAEGEGGGLNILHGNLSIGRVPLGIPFFGSKVFQNALLIKNLKSGNVLFSCQPFPFCFFFESWIARSVDPFRH